MRSRILERALAAEPLARAVAHRTLANAMEQLDAPELAGDHRAAGGAFLRRRRWSEKSRARGHQE